MNEASSESYLHIFLLLFDLTCTYLYFYSFIPYLPKYFTSKTTTLCYYVLLIKMFISFQVYICISFMGFNQYSFYLIFSLLLNNYYLLFEENIVKFIKLNFKNCV